LSVGGTGTFGGDLYVLGNDIYGSGPLKRLSLGPMNKFYGNLSASGYVYSTQGMLVTSAVTASMGNISAFTGSFTGGISSSTNIYMNPNRRMYFNGGMDSDINFIMHRYTSNDLMIKARKVLIDITGSGEVMEVTGPISASGTIYASAFSSPGGDGDIDLSNSLDVSGNITASGDIWVSGSGDILLDEDQRIYFEEDKQTWIEANGANLIRIVAHNNQMLLLDSQTGNRAVFGNGTKVFIGNNNNALPTETLQVDGNISSSGAISTNSHITASAGMFTNLPTTPAVASVGELYTLSGSQLPFATGSAGTSVRALWNQYSASKFVLIK